MTRIYRNLVLMALSVGALWSCASNPDAIGPLTLDRLAHTCPVCEPTQAAIALAMNPDYTAFLALMGLYLLVLLLAVWPHPGHLAPGGSRHAARHYRP